MTLPFVTTFSLFLKLPVNHASQNIFWKLTEYWKVEVTDLSVHIIPSGMLYRHVVRVLRLVGWSNSPSFSESIDLVHRAISKFSKSSFSLYCFNCHLNKLIGWSRAMVIVGEICVFTHSQQVRVYGARKRREEINKIQMCLYTSKYTLVTLKHCLW